MLLTADRVVTAARILEPGWVRVDGDAVADVGGGPTPEPADVALGPVTVVPGLVDAHTHGGGGAAFTTGSAEEAVQVLEAHRVHGTTTMIASLVTDSVDRLEGHVQRLRPLVEDGALAGIHLEGPWLSPLHSGAHDPALLLAPSTADVGRLVAAGGGAVRMVTLAPELPGATDAVRQLTDAGVVVAVGHTDATYDQTKAAVAAGARVATHLFNAMRPVHHREPGPVVALLEEEAAYIELITDGVHLHPAVVRHAANAAPERFVLVTDAMAAAASADGDYQLGPMAVQVRQGVARLVTTGAIAGSTLTMARAVQYSVLSAGLPLHQVVQAATSRPAALLGLTEVGDLAPGMRADLVVLDADLAVTAVMHRGRWVGGAPHE